MIRKTVRAITSKSWPTTPRPRFQNTDLNHFHARHNRVWDGADLVMEVVSDDPKDRARDYQQKLADYAEAKISEYRSESFSCPPQSCVGWCRPGNGSRQR